MERLRSALAHRSRGDLLKWALLLVFCLYIVVYAASYWLAAPPELIPHFADDAYFYFKVARNVVHMGRFTFDGQTLTNGFHPLWMLVLLPIFAAVADPLLVLRIVGTLSIGLLGWSCYAILQRSAWRYSLFAYAAVVLFLFRYVDTLAWAGIEASLVVPLCVLALLMLERSSLPDAPPSTGQMWLLGGVLALAQLARLDAVFFSGVVIALVVYYDMFVRKTFAWRRWIPLVLPGLVTGAGYLAVNYVTFQHFIPVSGAVKAAQGLTLNRLFLRQLTAVEVPRTAWGIWPLFALMAVLSLGYLIGGSISLIRRRRLLPLSATTAAAFMVIFTLYYLLRSDWRLWAWYAYPGLLAAVFVLPEALDGLKAVFATREWLGNTLPRLEMPLAVIVLVGLSPIMLRSALWMSLDRANDFVYQNYVLAQQLNARFDQPARVAMGDRAGSFAYFYNGSVLQLEGLVSSYAQLEAQRHNVMTPFITDQGVNYILIAAPILYPPEDYTTWTLVTPLPYLGSGPVFEIALCRRSEVWRWERPSHDVVVMWAWPSCP